MLDLPRTRFLLGFFTLLVVFLLLTSPAAAIDCPSCDDFNFCTLDSCDTGNGTCRHEPRNCNDDNPCTIDSCFNAFNNGQGSCRHAGQPVGTLCNDGNSCTAADSCNSQIQCTGTPLPESSPCDDKNGCTISDLCSASGECAGTLLPAGADCSDGSLCTSGDTCVPDAGGALACQGTAQSCDDADPCTQDSCDPVTGQCGHPPTNCNDGNVCTADSCDPAAGGCVRTPVSGSCSTGRLCTVGDACSGGNCFPGAPRNCSDNVGCTVDTCSEALGGCLHRLDDSFCPPDGPCSDWFCGGTNGPNTLGGCVNRQRNGFFNCDGNICKPDQCSAGFCQSPTGPPNFLPCDDLNPCTTSDTCGNYECHGTPVSCDDGDACTTDSCVVATGQCAHQPNTGGGTCGVGACLRTVTCPEICVPGTPTPEECNGIDDDCNGSTDDLGTTSCGLGACARTVANCVNGAPQTCVPGTPTSEVCNGADDDCNGMTDELGTTTCGVGTCTRTVANCVNGVPQTCAPGIPAAEVCNFMDDDCDGEIDEGRTTCGLGACANTVDSCVNGQPQSCTPGNPTPEDICNGIDDDCDGVSDQGRIEADCTINPSTFNLNAQGSTFNIECKLTDRCTSGNPVPGTELGTVYISRVDSGEGVALPEPATLPCPDPVLGSLYERGIVEDAAARQNTPKGATFKFDVPSDGDCATLDGDRQDLAGRLAGFPDNSSATICVSGKVRGADFMGCTTALVRNKGLR
jgi:slime mold repeat-containing protein/putative metal-binding protein